MRLKGLSVLLLIQLLGLKKVLPFVEWSCYDIPPRNEPNSNLVNWIMGILITLVVIIVITGIFLIRKKRTGNLAFIDDTLQPSPTNDTENPEYFNENEHGNLENIDTRRFGHGLFSIYCRSCYAMMERRHQDTQSLNLNCFTQNSDHQGLLHTDEGME